MKKIGDRIITVGGVAYENAVFAFSNTTEASIVLKKQPANSFMVLFTPTINNLNLPIQSFSVSGTEAVLKLIQPSNGNIRGCIAYPI